MRHRRPPARLVILHHLPSGEEVVVEEEHDGEAKVEAIDLPRLRASTARHALLGVLALALAGWAGRLPEGTVRTGVILASAWVGWRNVRSYMRKRKLMQAAHAAIRDRHQPALFSHPEA